MVTEKEKIIVIGIAYQIYPKDKKPNRNNNNNNQNIKKKNHKPQMYVNIK